MISLIITSRTRSMRKRLSSLTPLAVAASIALVALPGTASAQGKGDIAAGKQKALTCMGCHGADRMRNAYPTFLIPKLGGQHAEYLITALKAYKTGDRNHETMRAQAASLSDQDIADLAAYLASLK